MNRPNTLDRNEQLARLRERYARRNKRGRSRRLEELCEPSGYDRKHAIKLRGDSLSPCKGSAPPGPRPRYEVVRDVLETLWEHAEQLCGKRLAPALALGLPHYGKHFNPRLPVQKQRLKEISPATLDRRLADQKAAPHGLCATRPGTLLRQQLPMAGEVWDQRRPGFLAVDRVAHCGGSLAGDFVWSLTDTCLGSGWTEGRAVWNKGSTGRSAQTQEVEAHRPFVVRGADFDNGSAGLNGTLIRHWQERPHPVRLTRSRPDHKDDNAHVEQKNGRWPRQWLGSQRLENVEHIPLINALDTQVWGPRHNFFLPATKLLEKPRDGRRSLRKHDAPQTAYQRRLQSGELKSKASQKLRAEDASLDPFALAKDLNPRLKKILN